MGYLILRGFKIKKFGLRTLLTTGLSMLLATGICSGAGFQQKCLAAEDAAPVINAGASTGEKDLEINGSALQGKADLVFIHDGLLYILDGRTGQVIKVSDSGQAIKPVWSFDGQWLAYIRLTATEADSGALWLVKRDGTQNHQVEELPGPVEPDDYAWSPHANKLALNCQGIWLADPQGQPKQLVQKESAYGFAWSPDGRCLAYSLTLPQAKNESPESRSDALYILDLSNGKTAQHLVAPESGIKVASWWPDGQGILYWTIPLHSASLTADGADLFSYKLFDPEAKLIATGLAYREWLSLSPEERLIYISGSGRTAWTEKCLEFCNTRTGFLKKINPLPASVVLDPSFSSDGGKMAFVTAKDLGAKVWGFKNIADLYSWINTRTLWTADSDGTGAKPLTKAGQGIYRPEWSNDGKSLMYVSEDSVWLIDDQGHKRQRVVGPLSLPGSSNDFHFGFYGHASYGDLMDWFKY
jgi:Tol biopolymer transport system component